MLLLSMLNRLFLQIAALRIMTAAGALLLVISIPAMANTQAEMKVLQENIQKLQKELKQIQGNRSQLQQELQKSESDMSQLQKKIDTIQQELKQQNKEINNLQDKREKLSESSAAQQQNIAEQLIAAHRSGNQSTLKLLLNQESPEAVARLLAYHQRLAQAQSEQMQNYIEVLNQLDAVEPQLLTERSHLAASEKSLHDQISALKNQQQRRQQLIAKTNRELSTKDGQLKQFQEDRTRLQKLLAEVARTIGNVPLPAGGESFDSRRGKLPWPTQGKISAGFGSQRVGAQMQWNGILITAQEGQSVIAVHHGRVVFADYFRGHGLLVIVDHGGGYLSLYAHNQQLLRNTGDAVRAGEALAKVGNSGGQEVMGLYFEIRKQGVPINPTLWLARA